MLREIATRIILASLWGYFAYTYALSFLNAPRITTFLLLVLETAIAIVVLIRRESSASSTRLKDRLYAFGNIALPFFFRPESPGSFALTGEVLLGAGVLMVTVGLWSLGRSFGIIPANRGVASRGAYRMVRHPMYAGYVIAYVGYVLAQPSYANAAVCAATVGLFVPRLLAEERILSEDPAYCAYQKAVPWRLVPYLW